MASSSKALDVLVATLTDTLKSIDTSILLAFTAAAFLLIHGLQGDFAAEIERQVSVAATTTEKREADAKRDATIQVPGLGVQATLLTASLFALTLYWVFCLRAGFRARHVKTIAANLMARDPEVLKVALLYPSLATGTATVKVLASLALGLLGFTAFFLMYLPLENITGRKSTGELALAAATMFLPAAYLCWELLRIPPIEDKPQ